MLKLKRNIGMLLVITIILTNMIGVLAVDSKNNDTLINNLSCNEAFTPPTKEETLESEIKVQDMMKLIKLLGFNCPEGNYYLGTSKNKRLDAPQVKDILEKYNNVLRYDGPTPPLNYYIPLTPTAQSNGYYCGPASAYMVLKQQGANVTQNSLASELGTTTNGTSFGQTWANVFNNYSNHSYNVLWGSSVDSTQRAIELTDTAIGTLVSGYGVVYNTIQYTSESARLVGYPRYISSNIYHYVAGEGYDVSNPSNRICHYIDPNQGYTNSYGRHDIGFRLMCTLMKDRGMIA